MRRAVTLIETLAVVVILGLAASVALVSFAGVEHAGALRRATGLVRDFDARVRIVARAERAVELRVDGEGTTLVAVDPLDPETSLLKVELPDGVTALLEWSPIDAAPMIDRRGRSADYRVVLRRADATSELLVHGLTGQVVDGSDSR